MLLRYVNVFTLCAVLLCSQLAFAQQRQEVLLLTYHLKAPFIVDLGTQQGLYYDLAHYFNQRSSNYWFKTEFVPRKRINTLLERPFAHVVLGVQPIWFKQVADRMSFTPPILLDDDVFVSLKTKAVTNQDLAELTGKTFIGVQGYHYVGLDAALKTGSLARVDTLQEENVLDMLRLGRGDFAIISMSTLNYKTQQDDDARLFYIATEPHEHIARRMMYSKNDMLLGQELLNLLAPMPNDPDWLAILAKYNLDIRFIPQP
ncbi:transporter substrate-binding domain-containing protein [Rheinheimera muenzenbergensis]|uniref:Transporter substrate-binding domain-containing protein n=1 Tax=Rheinheimera muenzenbergensis TaxID=1193628 RepID=A0ABU8C6E0_9GAMM